MRNLLIGNCAAAIATVVATVFSGSGRLVAAPLRGGENITCGIDDGLSTRDTCRAAIRHFRNELSKLSSRRNSSGSLLNAQSYTAMRMSLEKDLSNAYGVLKHIAPDEADQPHKLKRVGSKKYLFDQDVTGYSDDNYSGVTVIGQLATSEPFYSIFSVVGTITVPTLSVPQGDSCVAPTIYDTSEWLGIGGESELIKYDNDSSLFQAGIIEQIQCPNTTPLYLVFAEDFEDSNPNDLPSTYNQYPVKAGDSITVTLTVSDTGFTWQMSDKTESPQWNASYSVTESNTPRWTAEAVIERQSSACGNNTKCFDALLAPNTGGAPVYAFSGLKYSASTGLGPVNGQPFKTPLTGCSNAKKGGNGTIPVDCAEGATLSLNSNSCDNAAGSFPTSNQSGQAYYNFLGMPGTGGAQTGACTY